MPSSLNDKIIVALDFSTEAQTFQLLDKLAGHVTFVKVGMELFYALGKDFIKKLKERNLKIFLDLKVHDIPNTSRKAIKNLTHLDIDLINIHAAGGIEMMKACAEEVKETSTKLIGVTWLTSISQESFNEELGFTGSLQKSVIQYAQNAKMAGLSGVVASPLEVPEIKSTCGKDFITVTPGIRLKDSGSHDQKRITTPEAAIKLGSDYLVVGRSITKANNPLESFKTVLKQVEKGL